MKREEKANREYKTFEEYQKAFSPKSLLKEHEDIKDPQLLGAMMARQSLEKCRNILLRK